MSLYSVNYFYDNIDQVHAEIAEVCLFGKPPYSTRCTRCSKTNTPCLLYAVIRILDVSQNIVYCDECCSADIEKRTGIHYLFSGDH